MLAPRAWRVLALAVLIASTTACRQTEKPAPPQSATNGEVVLDLIAELPAALVSEERAILNLGDASARPHLIAGWSDAEEDAAGVYAWTLGPRASFTFFAADATEVTLGLRCQPLLFDEAPEQTLRISLGGEFRGDIAMQRELKVYRLKIAADHVVGGLNRVDLDVGYYRQPRSVIAGSNDDRELGIRCFDIELEGLGAEASPRGAGPEEGTASVDEQDRLELPLGTSTTYYFEHASSAELIAEALEAWGPEADAIRLIVRSASADGPPAAAHRIDPATATRSLRLPLETSGPAVDRLELATARDGRDRRASWLTRLFGERLFGKKGKPSGLTLVLPSVQATGPAIEPAFEGLEHDEVVFGTGSNTTRPNVIIYLIDTLRADHLGTYGYSRPTSPNIDRFAAGAMLFENARAQSSWTRPTVVSLLTGLAPRRHGVNRREDALSDSVDTLAELLAGAGYATAGFITNGNAGPNFGLGQGFEEFRHLAESADREERHQLSDHLNRWLFHWLENRGDDDRPFLLYAHSTDPHVPYTPKEPFRSRFAPNADRETGRLARARAIFQGRVPSTDRIRRDLIDLYDAEIAFNDHHFGQLIERLKELNLYDNSLIVLVSDHGEEFLDHGGWEHGITLFDEQLHVPLILKFPHQKIGQRISATTSQIDVVPTILDLLNIAPPELDGVSLLDASERASFAYLALSDRQLRSITHNDWKLILDDSLRPLDGPLQLFSLTTDEEEQTEVSEERPFERELLAQLMRRYEFDLAQGAQAIGEQAEIPEELRRQLEALGYL